MDKLSYCLDCKKIFNYSENCSYCSSTQTKDLVKGTPVNVIGTKLKGRVLNSEKGTVKLLFEGEKRVKSVKEVDVEKIRKIL